MTVPDDVKAYKKGVALFKAGKVLEALRYFKFAAETGEDRPMEHFALAAAYMQVGNLDGAQAEYARFLAMKPGQPQQEHAARKVIAGIEQKRLEAKVQAKAVQEEKLAREQAAAVADEERRKKQQLEQMSKLYEEALSFFRGGGYDSALGRLESLLESWGRTAEVLNVVGLCHKKKGDSDKAVEVFREALAEDPDNADVQLNLAQTYFDRGVQSARPLIEAVVKKKPENAQAWFNLGVVALAAGDFERAQRAWERAQMINPEDRLAQANLEMIKGRQQ